jgi:membrane-associated protein
MILIDAAEFFRTLWENPGSLFNPEQLLRIGGLVLLLLMIFAETGIFFCFFFPGDSLVFAAGVLTATGDLHGSIVVVMLGMVVAATLGNLVGYWFGRSLGTMAYKRPDKWYFRREYLDTAEKFYHKYGGLALMAGRFFPVIRTFAPIVAGIIKLDLPVFIFYSVAGAITWVVPLALSGYFLGQIPFVEENLEFILLGFVIVITTPVIVRLVQEGRKRKKADAS